MLADDPSHLVFTRSQLTPGTSLLEVHMQMPSYSHSSAVAEGLKSLLGGGKLTSESVGKVMVKARGEVEAMLRDVIGGYKRSEDQIVKGMFVQSGPKRPKMVIQKITINQREEVKRRDAIKLDKSPVRENVSAPIIKEEPIVYIT